MAYAPAAGAAAFFYNDNRHGRRPNVPIARDYRQEFHLQNDPASGIKAEVQGLVNLLSTMRDDMTTMFDRRNINYDELEEIIAYAREVTAHTKHAVAEHFDQRERDIRTQRDVDITALAMDVDNPITHFTVQTYLDIKYHAERCQALNHLECSRLLQQLDEAIDRVNMHLNLLLWAERGMADF